MNKNYKILIVFFILFSLLFPTNLVKGATDIAYTFNDNVLIDSAITDFDSTFNVKNSSYYTEHYNATYSFENEIDGTFGTNIDFVDYTDNPNELSIISNFQNHDKVLKNNPLGAFNVFDNYYNDVMNGVVEFWYATNDSSERVNIQLLDNTGVIIYLRMEGNDLKYYDGAVRTGTGFTIENNQWYHIKVELYNNNTWDYWINAIQYANGVDTRTNLVNGLDTFRVVSYIHTDYFDAIGYSWQIDYGNINYTYSFNELTSGNEFSATGIYSNWIYSNPANTDIYVRDSTPIDQEFLRFRDDSGAGFPSLRIPFTATTINAFSYYLRFSDVSQIYEWYIQDDANDRISMRVDSGNLRIYDGVVDTIIMAVSNNVWYNISVSFDCATDTNQVFVDSNLKGTYDFLDPSATLNYFEFRTNLFDTGITMDFDSITNLDYIRLNYPVGLNLLPYINSTDFKEVDKYEFALANVNVLNAIASSNPSGWTDVEGGNGITSILAGFQTNDREVGFIVNDNGDYAGLRKAGLGITGNFINVSFGYTIISSSGIDQNLLFVLESSDTTEITGLAIDFDGYNLTYWTGSTFLELRSDLGLNEYYEFNLLLNYELDLVFLDYYVDGIYIESYNYAMTTTGKSGLNEIEFIVYSFTNGHASVSALDYCGVYSNGISQSSEYAFTVYNIGQTWNTQINNLLYLKANGTFHIGIVQGSYTVGMSMTTFRSLRNYYNDLTVVNGYDSDTSTNNATFIFTLQNHYFNISTFKIDGVLLKEGVNEYSLEFEHSGVNIDESYFYVDTSNRLQFRHIADDTNLEYIQATFDINDVNSTDYAFSFRSNMDNNAYGYVRINYTDTSNLIQIPYILTTTRFLLYQERTVRDIIILITDKDNNVITGLTSGYIYNIELIDVISIDVSIITQSLLNMIIPLIIILTPTLLFSQKFGKQVIIPLFILFSLVLTITGLIPYWLFFIIIFPSIIMVFFKSKKEVN